MLAERQSSQKLLLLATIAVPRFSVLMRAIEPSPNAWMLNSISTVVQRLGMLCWPNVKTRKEQLYTCGVVRSAAECKEKGYYHRSQQLCFQRLPYHPYYPATAAMLCCTSFLDERSERFDMLQPPSTVSTTCGAPQACRHGFLLRAWTCMVDDLAYPCCCKVRARAGRSDIRPSGEPSRTTPKTRDIIGWDGDCIEVDFAAWSRGCPCHDRHPCLRWGQLSCHALSRKKPYLLIVYGKILDYHALAANLGRVTL